LLVLTVDLIINKQSGMSSGLRLLLDQNGSHVTALKKAGYKPALSTIILAGAGIAVMYVLSPSPSSSFPVPAQLVRRPFISYAQYRFWKEPFSRTEASLNEHHIAKHGQPIVMLRELESPVPPGGKPFAPFNVVGTPLRASEAFERAEPEPRKLLLEPPAPTRMKSRFSHQ
jgi:hypothetical protein